MRPRSNPRTLHRDFRRAINDCRYPMKTLETISGYSYTKLTRATLGHPVPTSRRAVQQLESVAAAIHYDGALFA
jgi:hypothetical protein